MILATTRSPYMTLQWPLSPHQKYVDTHVVKKVCRSSLSIVRYPFGSAASGLEYHTTHYWVRIQKFDHYAKLGILLFSLVLVAAGSWDSSWDWRFPDFFAQFRCSRNVWVEMIGSQYREDENSNDPNILHGSSAHGLDHFFLISSPADPITHFMTERGDLRSDEVHVKTVDHMPCRNLLKQCRRGLPVLRPVGVWDS